MAYGTHVYRRSLWHQTGLTIGAYPSNRRVAIPARAGNFWHFTRSGDNGVPDADDTPRSRAAEGGAKSIPPCGVGLKRPACFVVGSCRLIIQSRLDPPPRIRGISAPSQCRPLLRHASRPGLPAECFGHKHRPRPPQSPYTWPSRRTRGRCSRRHAAAQRRL